MEFPDVRTRKGAPAQEACAQEASAQEDTSNRQEDGSDLNPTQAELQNIAHKRAMWVLMRGEAWSVNLSSYPQRDAEYQWPRTLYKVLCVIDPDAEFSHEKVAEAKEFIDFWRAMSGDQTLYG